MLSISPEVSFSIKDEVMENLDRMVVSEFLDFIKNGSMSIFQDQKADETWEVQSTRIILDKLYN